MKLRRVYSRFLFLLIALMMVVFSWQPASGDDPAPVEKGLPVFSDAKGDPGLERAEERNLVSVGEPVEPVGSGGPDQYGYTWSDGGAYSWLDLNAGNADDTELSGDDLFFGPVPVGFSFPFYEKTETELYISTNGMLLFGSNDISFNNRSIPFVGVPSGFIAPFWDDLDVNRTNGGRVYYQAFADKFVVAWKSVTRHGAPELLTFEAILYPNGNVCYQYQDLNGTLDSATVGLEDSDGIDGLAYLYNAPGISALEGTHSLCFNRPPAHYETKVLPIYQGRFTEENVAEFSLEIRNIGSQGPDTFDLSAQSVNPSWAYALYNENSVLLKDTNANGKPDTGSIPAGSSVNIVFKAIAPGGAEVGAHTLLTLTATSAHDLNQKRDVKLQAAIPTAFGQAVKNSETGIDLDLIWPHSQRATTLAQLFTGSNLAVATLLDSGYMYLWERNGEKSFGSLKVTYTDIEYSILSRAGIVEQGTAKLTSNYDATLQNLQVADTSPTLAVNSTGQVGITWKRELLRTNTFETNSNIYFLIFDLANLQNPVLFETNVTQNTGWWTTGVQNVPVFGRPKVKATADGHFIITWEEKREQAGGEENNISLAVYSTDKTQVAAPHKITASVPGHILYREPGLTGLSGNRALAAYSEYNIDTQLSKPSYQIVNSAGSKIGQGSIPGVNGWLATAAELGSDKILFAWTQTIGGTSSFETQVAYTLLDGGTYTPSTVTLLPTPNGREADYVSVSIDGNGYGIITWIDVDLYQGLYYALINQDGTLRTAVISFEPVGPNSALVINDSGYSLASYMGSYLTYLPTTVKK